MKTKDDTNIIVIPEREAIVVVRTPEQFAAEVMKIQDCGKIHKPHHLDPFIPFRKR